MKVTVNEQAQRFWLGTEEMWEPVAGHEIKVGKYRFCAIPMRKCINVSEVTTGARVTNLPLSDGVMILTATKEGTLEYFKGIGEFLKTKIVQRHDFDEQLAKAQKETFERLGEMPPIEDVDYSEIVGQ